MKSIEQRDLEKKSLIDSRWAYQGRVVNLRLDTFQFGEETRVREIIHHAGAVVILPIDSKGKILLIQQWRRAVNEILIELPAGTLEPGEEPRATAIRELREETGFDARKLTSLGGFFSCPGFCDEFLHLFVAEDLHPSPLPPDDDEKIDLLPVTLSDALHLIETHQIRDAKTVAGILKYAVKKI